MPRAAARALQDGNLHIMENGQVQAQGWLNAATAYLEGFFHVDPKGVQAASSIGEQAYDPALIDADQAARYAQMLHARFTARRHSRYRQMGAVSALPKGALVLFFKGPALSGQVKAFPSFQCLFGPVWVGAEGGVVDRSGARLNSRPPNLSRMAPLL